MRRSDDSSDNDDDSEEDDTHDAPAADAPIADDAGGESSRAEKLGPRRSKKPLRWSGVYINYY